MNKSEEEENNEYLDFLKIKREAINELETHQLIRI